MEAPRLTFPWTPTSAVIIFVLTLQLWSGFLWAVGNQSNASMKVHLYISVHLILHDFFPFILLLFSGSPCCTWTATSVWTCRQKKTSWFPPSETATTAAPSSGCSVTWPWASDPPLGPAAGAAVLHDPGSPHHHQVDVSACVIHLFLHQPGQDTGIDATVSYAPSCGCFRS